MDSVYWQTYPDYQRPNRGKDPRSYNTIRERQSFSDEFYNSSVGFAFELYATVIWRIENIKANFFHDFFQTKAMFYPLFGIFEFSINYKYWNYGFIILGSYIILFCVLLWLYAAFLLPILAGWQIMLFGPVGLVIAITQMVLQCNIWTLRGIRNFVFPIFNDDIFELTLLKKGQLKTLQILKMRQLPAGPELHLNHIEFWIHDVPFNTFSFLRWGFVFIALALISLIPIVGPFTANLLQTPDRVYGYYDVWMRKRRLSDKAKRDEYYSRLGQLWAFGLISGLLELIPGFSAILMITNIIAIGIWAHDDIKHSRVQI